LGLLGLALGSPESQNAVKNAKESAMTARITQVDYATSQGPAKELLDAVKGKMGMVPNLMKTMAVAPPVLEGYLGLNGALKKGVLTAALREQIALAVSQANGCEYCLSAHSLTGKMAGLKPDEILDARRGKAHEPKAQAALTLAQNMVERRGNVSDEQMAAARQGGLTDAEIVEVVGNVVVMTFTNYMNNVAHTVLDFPKVSAEL
jgi:uncharacterized peroxidase-related enzyme